MIIWINGAFGSGKTTTAALLTKRVAEAKVFDPEYVGYMLTSFIESPTGDFQDLPLWRHLVVETTAGLALRYPHPWIVPMSLVNAAYRGEILGGLRKAGAEVREFVLVVPEDRLRMRIDEDQVEVKARQWRHDHVGQALAEFGALTDATLIDGSQSPEQVAEEVLARLR